MLKLKIRLTAKKEYKKYGGKYVNSVIVWEKLPFIAKQLTEYPVAHRKIIIKERKANKIFHNIQTVQADYARIITDCKEELERINAEIHRQEEKIVSVENELKRRNEQIQAFHKGEVVNTAETIFEIKDIAARLSKKITALEYEKEEMYKKIEMTKSDAKNKLDEKYKELKSGYTDFSTRIDIATAKIRQKILDIRNYAILYTDYFWSCYIKQYVKKKKKEGIKINNIEIPLKPKLNTEQFQLTAVLFDKEKKEINDFNSKYKIDYTI